MSLLDDEYLLRGFWRELKYLVNSISENTKKSTNMIQKIDFANFGMSTTELPNSLFNMINKCGQFLESRHWIYFSKILELFIEKNWKDNYESFQSGLTELLKELDNEYTNMIKQKLDDSKNIETIPHISETLESDLTEFHLNYSSRDEEIIRLAERLGMSRVVLSPGSRAKTFHAHRFCQWMLHGRMKAAHRGSDLPEVIEVELSEAINNYKRAPCQTCFALWWQGEFVNNSFSTSDSNFDYEIGDEVFIIDGPFASLSGKVIEKKVNTYIVNVEIYGKFVQVKANLPSLKQKF